MKTLLDFPPPRDPREPAYVVIYWSIFPDVTGLWDMEEIAAEETQRIPVQSMREMVGL